MSETPEAWLTIIGLGEDGPAGLTDASRAALAAASIVFGGPRHLELAGIEPDRARPWPVPFDPAPVLALRGQPVVVLASGDPFWHGAGGTLSQHLQPAEWRCHSAPSTPSLAAARLGWRLEHVTTLGLHSSDRARLRPLLQLDSRLIVTLRDGLAAADLAGWLTASGFGPTRIWVLEALGGPQERIRRTTAERFGFSDVRSPCAAALEVRAAPGRNPGLPRSPGLDDAMFVHDGQITKAPIRAMTIAALAPHRDEHLWDIGGGSGSVSVEWTLAGGHATCLELRADRAANIRANAENFGLSDRIRVVEGRAPDALQKLPAPAAIFVGGGFSEEMFAVLRPHLGRGARLVVNGVTLQTQSLLATLHADYGGRLLKIDIAQAQPLGNMAGWKPARPVVQWSLP